MSHFQSKPTEAARPPITEVLPRTETRPGAAGIPSRSARYGAVLMVVLLGLAAVEAVRRAEPFIGRRIADLFVFAILKNDPEGLIPKFAAAHAPNLLEGAGRL